jgi:hypothetical protein
VHRFVAWILTFQNGYELPYHAGEDDSTTVPEDIGKLELIIRHLHESDSGSDSSSDCMSGKDDSEDDRMDDGKDNSKDESEDVSEDDSEDDSMGDSEDVSEDDSEDDEPEDSDDPDYGGRAVRREVKRSRGTTHNGTTTEFTEFKNAKPRQTHSAE